MSAPRLLHIALAVFDRAAAAVLAGELRKLGCVCDVAKTLQEFEGLLRAQTPDVMVVELGSHAVSMENAGRYSGMAVVVAVAAPDPELFFRAARAGVESVLALPLDATECRRVFSDICHRMRLPTEGAGDGPHLHASSVGRNGPHAASPPVKALHATIPPLFAASEEMAEVRGTIEKVAPTSATVLLRGESGVGKELAARLIHNSSLRAAQPFVKVNCAAIPNELLESELFGYEAGAFTGALKGKPGKFELADKGTIFLDEIGEMHPLLQAKLLHVLQDGDFARLGSKHDISVDVRVICATNQPLETLVAAGKFREDLYYRVNVVSVNLPPLRARQREIPVLLDYFVRHYAGIYGKSSTPIEEAAVKVLTAYAWPGNIRELENLCKRYVIVGGMNQILREIATRQQSYIETNSEHMAVTLEGTASSGEPPSSSLSIAAQLSLLDIGKRAAWAAEREAIESMLRETHWNRREAARRLHVSYKALLNKIRVLECTPKVL